MGNTVTLLWTGGWDSTFRLLQLLGDSDARVRPVYLVHESRDSAAYEIDAIRTIRTLIEEHMPGWADRLLPTEYESYLRIAESHSHYWEKWRALNGNERVGSQYPVLASYAEHNKIDYLELSIEATTGSAAILESIVEYRDTPAGSVPTLDTKKLDSDDPVRLFERFAFPLLEYTKLDMKGEARRRGWMPIL